MFTRFNQNVRQYPRTFMVLCLALAGTLLTNYVVGRVVGIDARRVALYILASVVTALVIDGFIYRWLMGNPFRVISLLNIMSTFEGRTPAGEARWDAPGEEDEEETDEEETDDEDEEEESEECEDCKANGRENCSQHNGQ